MNVPMEKYPSQDVLVEQNDQLKPVSTSLQESNEPIYQSTNHIIEENHEDPKNERNSKENIPIAEGTILSRKSLNINRNQDHYKGRSNCS